MDPNEAKPPQEPADAFSMMQQMMERMCGTGEVGPTAMCKRMMASMRASTDAGERATPEPAKSGESPGNAEDGCCGPGSRCAPKRP